MTKQQVLISKKELKRSTVWLSWLGERSQKALPVLIGLVLLGVAIWFIHRLRPGAQRGLQRAQRWSRALKSLRRMGSECRGDRQDHRVCRFDQLAGYVNHPRHCDRRRESATN